MEQDQQRSEVHHVETLTPREPLVLSPMVHLTSKKRDNWTSAAETNCLSCQPILC